MDSCARDVGRVATTCCMRSLCTHGRGTDFRPRAFSLAARDSTWRCGHGVAAPARSSPALPVPSRSDRCGGHSRGFDVHAGVFASASDREVRERLLRYCARRVTEFERRSVTPTHRALVTRVSQSIRDTYSGSCSRRVKAPRTRRSTRRRRRVRRGSFPGAQLLV